MYTFRDIPSPPKNMAYPIIHFMYTFVKMLIKIDNPSEQTVVVVYMESIQDDDVFLRNSKTFGTFTFVATKTGKGHSNPSGEWPAM